MRRLLPICLLIGAVVAVQLVTEVSDTRYYLTQLTMAAYYCLLIIGLSVLMGYAGQISLGHAGFFAIGGYLSAALTTHNLIEYNQAGLVQALQQLGLLVSTQDIYGSSLLVVAPWAAALAAVCAAALIAWLLGIPVLKLKGHYLAMATLGFGIIVYRVALASSYFGEADGISEVPPFQLPFGLAVSGDFSARVENYYIAWGVLIIGLILLRNLIDSRVGRALRAIHAAPEAAEAMGVDTARFKLKVFVISAVYAAVAGVFLTHYNGGIGPSEAGVMKSVRYVAIVAVGGMANLNGALLMGVVLSFMSLRGVFGTYDDAVFGLILIVIMLFAPKGVLSLNPLARVRATIGRRRLSREGG
ncbi:MAG: branched-chain amino acid ABC transporter permease [Desulfofustis sp. PB-SRB1]|jgi:branched-chain amino acid transport system permease protein|nr:branched-chain amino acid ABC transporter permease [Desulfofustis sp. PB-SRB1]MBM1002582.1 branched-chain amino acid ABC transporter permease [Desulfofustis sp. PB-SRB1]HBH27920.1 branched-chain amino acid ABC transporter permease [Desulfofustis sp.]HBH32186.1 branched-chain amino acid ABC transporter permease [Desulfofustis sp.]